MSSQLNLTNQQRLKRYPSGKCPLCGGTNYSAYIEVDDDPEVPNETGIQCDGCEEKYRHVDPIGWIDGEPIYRESPDESD
jgi:hypothetical protein